MEKELTRLIPPNEHAGDKVRINISYDEGAGFRRQPIMLPQHEKARLERIAQQRGVSMSDLLRSAVVSLRQRLAPLPEQDVEQMASMLGVPSDKLAQIQADPSVRFKADLIRLAAIAQVSLSRAARWALNVYLDSK